MTAAERLRFAWELLDGLRRAGLQIYCIGCGVLHIETTSGAPPMLSREGWLALERLRPELRAWLDAEGRVC